MATFVRSLVVSNGLIQSGTVAHPVLASDTTGDLSGSRVLTTMSLTDDGTSLQLVNDSGSPGNSKYYGTDGSGTRGYYTFSYPAAYTDEQAQDAVGGIFVDTSTIDFDYSDATPSISATALTTMSVTAAAGGIALVGDSASPGNDRYYGTNGSGTRGYYTFAPATVSDGDKGDITVSGSGATWSIDSSVISLAKMQNRNTKTVIGRKSSGSGVPEEVDIHELLDFFSAGAGAIIYRGSTIWHVLAAGASAQILSLAGSPLLPTWIDNQLTPMNYLTGLTLSNNGTDPTNDIDIAVGICRTDNNGLDMSLGSAITKRLDASWAVGSGNGGLDTGSIANTTYHVYVIKRTDLGATDVLFSTSATSPTMPSGYTHKRRIGSIIRVSGAIVQFRQQGDYFCLPQLLGEWGATNPGTSAVTRSLTYCPSGIKVMWDGRVGFTDSSGAGTGNPASVAITDPDDTDYAPDAVSCDLLLYPGNAHLANLKVQYQCMTNTSAQIRTRCQLSSGDTILYGLTKGWYDTRGQ